MEQLVTFPTHLKGNTLDLILTNVPDIFTNVRCEGRLGSSDHFMVMADMMAGK
jgi:hypothetical protein